MWISCFWPRSFSLIRSISAGLSVMQHFRDFAASENAEVCVARAVVLALAVPRGAARGGAVLTEPVAVVALPWPEASANLWSGQRTADVPGAVREG
jgi:hypothetical protein